MASQNGDRAPRPGLRERKKLGDANFPQAVGQMPPVAALYA
jgi:hypothetical protein